MKLVSNRFSILCAALGLASFLNFESQAQIVATDVANNYTNTGVSTGVNGGTGFGAWTVTTGSSGFAGIFVGNPGSASISDLPNPSFGMYANNGANPGGSVIASRAFSNALSVNQTFSLKWGVNWDSDNATGGKGFRLFTGGATGTQVLHIRQGGSPGDITLQTTSNGASVTVIPGANYGTRAMTWSFKLTDSNNLLVTATSRTNTNLVVNTNVSVSGAPNAIEFYATNMASGDNRQPYFNNLEISQGDGTPPVVTLSADKRLIAIPVGGSYTADAGATATDDVSTDVTSSITNDASTAVNLSVAGTYTVTYTARDAANNAGTATQTVVVHPVGTFASQYSSVAAPGIFNGWKADGSGNNALIKTANFNWKLFYYFPEAANTEYLITANNGYDIKWAAGGVRGAGGNANLSPTVNTNGWYVFELNEAADTASLSKFTSTTDADSDGIPDEWEAHYGAQLSLATNNLNPDTIYNESLGGSRTTKQAFEQGLNPIRDGRAPTLTFASGTTAMTLLSLNTKNTGVSDKWEILESDVVATGDSTNETVTVTLETRKLTGTAGLGVDPANIVDTSEASLWKITYAAFDPTGNTTNLVRSIVVGDAAPGWRKLQGPSTNTISTTGSATIYGRIYIDGATPGAGQAPNISAELGVIVSNAITGLVTADPSTWTGTGLWTTANYNSGFTGGDDEYQTTVDGSALTAGTYYYAFRFKIGEGAWRYAGIGGPWGTFGANTYGNGTLTVTAAQVRNVTFAVNMGVQRELGNFNPASDKVYLVGDAVGDWATGVEMLREGSTDVFKITQQIEGALGTALNYKFKSGNGAVGNEGYEGDVNPDPALGKDARVLTLGATDSPQYEGTVFFNNVTQVRSLTFKVDMGVQVTKNEFAHGDNLEVRFGNFNAGGKSLTREGSTTVYSGTFPVTGDAGDSFEYKFWKTNAAKGAVFERVDAPRTNNFLNRTYTLGSNGVAVTLSPTPFFSNDDGVAPEITLDGDATINLTVGGNYTELGATATKTGEGSLTATPSGSVDTTTAGTYTITYTAIDAAGNTATKTRTVVVATAGSTFAGWSSNALVTSELVGKYGIGGATSSSAASERPEPGLDSNTLSLSAIVRTNDAKLKVEGEASGSLTNWSTNGVTMTASPNTNGVPGGHQRQVFSVDRTNSPTKQFLRLKATLAP